MKKIDLGYTITILANVGVIAGIVFLAFELQQNNELLESQVQAYRFETVRGFGESIVANTALAEALAKVEGNEELSNAEEALLRAASMNIFRSWQWQFTEQREGRLDAESLEEALPLWRTAVRGEGIFRWPLGGYWAQMKHQFPASFVQFIDEYVVDGIE